MEIETNTNAKTGEHEAHIKHSKETQEHESHTKHSKEGQPHDSSKKEVKRLRIALGAMTFAALFLLIFLIVYATTQKDDDDDDYCTSKSCYTLSESIVAALDTTVDPCDDFFQYACGGFQELNEYQLSSISSTETLALLAAREDDAFLDGLFYPELSALKNNEAVQKAAQFFSSCMSSDNNAEETIASQLLEELVTMVDFDGASDWNTTTIAKFHDALAWLTARSWNYLFSLSALGEQVYFLRLNYDYWNYYYGPGWANTLNETIVPLYQSLFGLSLAQSYQIANDVWAFAEQMNSLTAYGSNYYTSTSAVNNYMELTYTTEIFGDSPMLNVTTLIRKQFNTETVGTGVYLAPDANNSFFENLATLIENTSPKTIQYYLFANVLIDGLNYQEDLVDAAEQPRYYSRSDYCVRYTKQGFPFVYGLILYQTQYGDETHEQMKKMVDTVINDGVSVLLNSNTFMDKESRDATNDKIKKLRTFVGYPPPIYDYTQVEKYYSRYVIGDVYMENLQQSLALQAVEQELVYNGKTVNMTGTWPSIFTDPSIYRAWLTGINAFYYPYENFFTIPVTITAPPFFSREYPSAINFGGIGGVIGHEMSHGFDPRGSRYDGDGNYVGSIWTSDTQKEYDSRVNCIIKQYNKLEIDDGVYVNGTITKTENVADNSGNAASWLAWQEWRKSADDPKLPLDMTDEQLFFLGWARSWCEVTRSGYYTNWPDVHAPNKARVWGVVQNSKEFAEAYGCSSGTFMNPEKKCLLWD